MNVKYYNYDIINTEDFINNLSKIIKLEIIVGI